MKRDQIRKKLETILDTAPALKDIFLSDADLDEKRDRIRVELTSLLATTFDDNPKIPSLEWIIKRDSNRAFRTILSKRSEDLAGFSFLKYVDDLLHKEDLDGAPLPSPGFLAEFDHLVKAMMGVTGVYADVVPPPTHVEGIDAARLRSSQLSEMTMKARGYMDRYPYGLESAAMRRRSRSKARIMNHFGGTDLEWGDWKWHLRHVIKDADTLRKLIDLTDDEYEAVRLARENRVPFGITPYYLSLMDRAAGGENDRALRAQVIPSLHYVNSIIASKQEGAPSMDFMLERDTSPIENITRRYPMIVILKPVLTCPQICVYCQRNWQIEDVHSKAAAVSKEKLDQAIQWIADTPEIVEVLVTGGDPFLLPDSKIERVLSKLAKIKHVERIRIGTRTPVTLPQRITEQLVRIVNKYHAPGRREVVIVTHFEHQSEISPDSQSAVQKFRRYGIEVYNQLVYTFYNSRKFEAAAMRHKLRLSGVTPYYTFNTKGKEETNDFRVPISRLMQEQKEEARLMPGTVRTDEIVFNVPKLGKNYLRAEQHHDVVTILPDGCRMYEFHPWEKNLSLVDTYVYTDVSIHDYLQRLEGIGENPADYRTIWYYY